MTLLAIDPGISSGWAYFKDDGSLLMCYGGHVLFPKAGPLAKAIIELPQVYVRRQSKGDPNDLITLAVRVGEYKHLLESLNVPVELVKPSVWKGQTDKSVCHAQYWPTFSPHEREIIRASGINMAEKAREDMLDAVCLGKWAFANRRQPPGQVTAVGTKSR